MDLITFVTIRDGKIFPMNRLIVKQPADYIQKDGNGRTKAKRSMQYVPSLTSVFINEQIKIDPTPVREKIEFTKKRPLVIDRDLYPNKVDFLERHEHLGVRFRVLDVAQEEMYQLKAMGESDDAKSYVLKVADANSIRAMAIEMFSPSIGQSRTVGKLRIMLREFAEQGETEVKAINDFKDDNFNQEKLLVSALLISKTIKLAGKTFSWMDSDEKIYTASQAQDAPRELAIWLKNDEEGRQTQAIFNKKIGDLKKK